MSRRAMESRRGRRNVSSSGESRSQARVYHAARSISSVFTSSARLSASARNPSMIEAGNGHGCDDW